MNKAELIAAVAEKTGFTKKDAEMAVNAMMGEITDALKKGDKVQLIGFGTFEVRSRKARTGRNPRKPAKSSRSLLPRLLFSRLAKHSRTLSTSLFLMSKQRAMPFGASLFF